MLSQSAASRPERTPRALRWIGVLLLVLVLHWIAAEWVERHRSAAQPLEPDHAPVQVALLKAERVEQAPAHTRAERACADHHTPRNQACRNSATGRRQHARCRFI
jgi:ABC-type nickel/cobalt efflux system permease component RcnA